MRRNTLALLALLAVAMALPGCWLLEKDATPQQKFAAAGTAYATVVESITKLAHDGILTPDDLKRINPYRLAARNALDAMKLTMDQEDMTDFKLAWAAFSAAMDVLVRHAAAPGGEG